jgi:hypothetical protein
MILGLRSDAGGEQSSMSVESAYCPGIVTCVFAMLAKWFSLTQLLMLAACHLYL